MKKLGTALLALAFLTGTTVMSFAQEPQKTEKISKKKKTAKKKTSKKKAEEPKAQ